MRPYYERLFTEAEDQTVIAGYLAGDTFRVIAERIGRPWTSVQMRTRILIRRGQLDNARRSRRPWTKAAEAELIGLWGWYPSRIVAQELGRSQNAVEVRAQRLGLRDGWKGAYSARGVGAIFAVDSKTVCVWIRHGWLKARKSKVGAGRSLRWRIEHEAIEVFIREQVPQYERRRITEPYWRSLADKAWAAYEYVPITVAAKKLGVCDETLKRRIRRGEWQAERVVCGGGFTWMVRRSDLERFAYWHPPVEGLVYVKGHSGAIRKAAAAPGAGDD